MFNLRSVLCFMCVAQRLKAIAKQWQENRKAIACKMIAE
jgi:hypothetical protein